MKKFFSFLSSASHATNDRFKDKQFFEAIMEHYPFAVIVQDKAGICQTCNKNFSELFKLKTVDVVGKKMDDILPTELCQQLMQLDHELYEKHQHSIAKQISYNNPDSQKNTLSTTRVLMKKDKLVLTVFEDITIRHQQEEELLHTRTLLQAILDNIPLGVYTRTGTGKMVYSNKQTETVLGNEDMTYGDKRHPKQTEDVVQSYKSREIQIIADGQSRDYPEEKYLDSRGEERIIHVIKIPLYQAGPEPVVLTIVDDITKRHQQEQEIKRANAFLSAIIDNVPIGLYARMEDGKMLFQNKQGDEIFHDTIDDLDDYGLSEHETKEQAENFLNREAEVLKTGKILDIPEENYVTKDNKNLILHMVKVPVKMPDETSGFVITMVEDITQRKQQERSLEEVRLFQQAILENTPIAIYAHDTNRQCLFENKASLELFERKGQEFSEEDYRYAKREKELFETKQILDIPEEEYTSRSGKRHVLHLIKVPVFTTDGKPFMVLTVAEDISFKKQQEKEISKAREFLQKVVDNLPVALSVKKADGKYVLWNKRSEELFGVNANTVIGKDNYRTDITREQAEFMLESDRKVFESKRELNIAQELISTPSEGVKIMHTVKTPIFTPTGEADYLLSVSEDITAKTKIEKRMREAGEKSTLLVENAREGIVILEDRQIIYSNQAICRLLGFNSPQELQGKRLSDFMSEDYQEVAKEKYEAVISQLPDAKEPISLRFVKQDGKKLEIEVSAISSKYLGRRIVIVFLRDMTTLNKTIREIRHDREKFKNVFEYNRTPLLILNHNGYIDRMNKAAQRLFAMTEQDRNFYRSVYIRPSLTLPVRQRLAQGLPAQMDYVFDFDRAREKFPERIHGKGVLKLRLSFDPFHIRNTEQGATEADYQVSIEVLSASESLETTSELPVSEKGGTSFNLNGTRKQSEKSVEEEKPVEPEQEIVEMGKTTTLGATSQNWMNTLNEVKLPAVMVDLQYLIGYANTSFLSLTGSNKTDIEQQNFFTKFVQHGERSQQAFSLAAQQATGNAFQIQLDLLEENGQYIPVQWDVLIMKGAGGKVEGYGLIASNKPKQGV